jgi:hypothetical protein
MLSVVTNGLPVGSIGSLLAVHPTGPTWSTPDDGLDESLLAAEHPFGGISVAVVFAREVKKTMNRVTDQLFTVRDIAHVCFPRGKI